MKRIPTRPRACRHLPFWHFLDVGGLVDLRMPRFGIQEQITGLEDARLVPPSFLGPLLDEENPLELERVSTIG